MPAFFIAINSGSFIKRVDRELIEAFTKNGFSER
jgi:hypothetical protein